MTDLSRRNLLVAAGASLASAGCTGLTGGDGETATRTGGGPTPADPRDGAAEPYVTVYDETIDSVVTVRVYTGTTTNGGTGFVRGDGTVVTNQHVVAGADRIDLAFTEGEWTSASVLGTDAYADLAAIEPDDRPGYADPLPSLDADPPIGTRVLALGNPYQLEASASSGIVSGVDRSLPGPNDFPIPDAIQTDAAVNPGNSGGPLVDLDGNVVGVITAAGGENIGFAISAPLAERIVPDLVATGSYSHAYVGVQLLTVTPAAAEANDLGMDDPHGVIVSEVLDGGPADGVLQGSPDTERVRGVTYPVGGDVIVALDDRRTPTLEVLSSYVALEKSPGDAMAVVVLRNGQRQTVEMTLGERPPAP
jgi:S1-C subfamily serine protease